ncbi:MAG: hypothetical protein FJ295_17690 [Planctomycetes bacterium]|nr:hypothetical protein [Planctomycetota bacterium]
MLHSNRRWCVCPAASAEELACKLTGTSWCCCTGFELDGYWFLNDSTSPDGVQEFAVVKIDGRGGRPVQVESITFGWCDTARALEHIRATLCGQYDRSPFAYEVAPKIEVPQQYLRCHHSV